MTRISLRETYDNRSVIAQIAKVTDTAEDAAETVQQKAAEIDDALTDVNAAVQAAEGAVTTANAASASAQQSAQTVAGYENRLGTAEGDIVQLNTDVDGLGSDLNAVTLRVTTAEGNIVTIQGQVTALQTADGQNVKINRINEYAVGLTGNQDNIIGVKTWANTQQYKNQYARLRANTTEDRGNFQLEVVDDSNNPLSRILLDKNSQFSGTGNTVHHLVVIGGRHIDSGGTTHEGTLRLSYNENTSKWVLSLNGATISEVSG